MTSSKITAMATLALALVLIGSIVTGHLFVVYALLPDTASIKITSPPKGQAVPVGNNLTISGISSDNATTDCHVYAGWNDLKPYHTVKANGAGGVNDYSKWAFTYSNTYHPITNGTNKLTAKLSCIDNTGSLAKWHSVNVTGVVPVVAASSSQSATNTTELLAVIQGKQNSTDKLQEAVFRSLHVQVPTISEINKISITQLQQEQHQQGATPQELQNALKILLDNLSTKQKGILTQQQVDLLEHISPIIQKGLSPQQGKQITSLLPQLTKRAMGQSYNIFDPVNGAVNLGFRLASLSDSGKLKPADVLIGLGAIYFSSQTGLSPDVLYKFGKDLLSQLPSPTLATTQVSSTIAPQKQPHPITKTDFGPPPPSLQDNKNKKDLVVVPIADCYDASGKNSYCVKTDPTRNVGFCNDDDIDCVGDDYVLPNKDATGKWYYPPNALEKVQKDAADKAQIDATRDIQGLHSHGYDSSCPSGHSKGYCISYKQAYDKQWNDLHSPSPIATSKALTAEQPTPTTDKGGNKVELDGYHCTNEGCGDYQDGICKTCGKPGADKAQIDARRDAQGLHGHGYDPSCPSGQTAEYCGDYKKAYDKQWNDLHPSVPTSTSNPPLTTEKPTTTTAPQPIATPDKSLQSGVVQQQQPATDSTPMESSPILGLLPSTTNGSPDNSVSPTDKSDSTKRAEIDASNDAKGLHGHGYDPSCPSGQSAGFCGDYKKAYDRQWNDLHSPSPISTNPSNNLISTPDKSLQNGVVQQQSSVPQKSEPSGQEITGTSPTTTNPTTSDQQGLVDSSTPNTNPPTSNTQPSGTQPNQEQLPTTPNSGSSGVQPDQGGSTAVPDQGQTTTTSPDQGTPADSSDGNSGANSLVPDTTTQSNDNNPTTKSTAPDQSLSGVQQDQGQATTTSQDKGTSGTGSSDDSSGSSSSPSGDSSTTSHDNNPSFDSSSTIDKHSSSHKHSSGGGDSSGDGDSKDSSGGGGDDNN